MNSEWLPRIVILSLLAIVVGVPFVLRPSEGEIVEDPSLRLIIMSPHNEQIRHEFSRAFNDWRARQGKPMVKVEWRSSGGTSDLRKQVLSEYEVNAKVRKTEGSYDLFYGGGEYDHNKLAGGVVTKIDGKDTFVPVVAPPTIVEREPGESDEDFFAREKVRFFEIFPKPTIGGEALYGLSEVRNDTGRKWKDLTATEKFEIWNRLPWEKARTHITWLGAALSSFGIVYNRDVHDDLGIAFPTTWDDLGKPEYDGWIALSDPAHSGSIAAAYNIILRRKGWTEGWRTLRRAFANARYFTSASSKVPVDVSTGDAAAGMAIDFYGRYQVGAIGDERMGYVDPPRMTNITADPITLLHNAPHEALANEFIRFVMSEEGQGLWQRKLGVKRGPEKFELRRLPIRRDMYTPEEKAKWRDDDVTPWQLAEPIPTAMPDFFGSVPIMSHALGIDNHAYLRDAWRAIQREPVGSDKRKRMEEVFYRMPDDATLKWPDDALRKNWKTIVEDPEHPRYGEVAKHLDSFAKHVFGAWKDDADKAQEDRLRWTLWFREQYREVLRIASED